MAKNYNKEALEKLEELEKILDERIVDLHDVKGGMQARHCYVFYRKLVWEVRNILEKNNG